MVESNSSNAAAAESREITRRAKSNLAFALAALPAPRRRDMVTFYAFCRLADDIADEPGRSPEEKRRMLDLWHRALDGPVAGEPSLAAGLRAVLARHSIPAALCHEILDGVAMDLHPRRFATPADLETYCHKVASVVGLVSIEIFGYTNPACRDYARHLGQALQWTNILRDIGEDARTGRIYLPESELARFQYTDADLFGRVHDGRFRALMSAMTSRTRSYYQQAIAALPSADKKSMAPAEAMRRIYSAILDRMESDHFKVFNKRYRINRLRMLLILLASRFS